MYQLYLALSKAVDFGDLIQRSDQCRVQMVGISVLAEITLLLEAKLLRCHRTHE